MILQIDRHMQGNFDVQMYVQIKGHNNIRTEPNSIVIKKFVKFFFLLQYPDIRHIIIQSI